MDGILVVNKPKGCTSHDIVYKIKKVCGEKVGHTGTLDPNATGILPLLIGKGTLISKYLINHDKKYEAILKLGIKTDTADGEGKIIQEKEINKDSINVESIESVFENLIGKQEQIPPMYSAIKVEGKKLYEYARKGQEVKLQPRTIEVYAIKLIKIENDEITFEVSCSKGTYIRSLCEMIAEKLDTVGYMKELKRIQVGEFNIKDAFCMEDIKTAEDIERKVISIETLFEDKEKIILEERKIQLLLNGVKLSISKEDGIYRVYNKENKFIGIATVKDQKLKRDVII